MKTLRIICLLVLIVYVFGGSQRRSRTSYSKNVSTKTEDKYQLVKEKQVSTKSPQIEDKHQPVKGKQGSKKENSRVYRTRDEKPSKSSYERKNQNSRVNKKSVDRRKQTRYGGRKHHRRVNKNYENKCKEEKKDPCDNFYCANGGSCIANSYDGHRYKSYQSSAMCICAGEWQGDRCDGNPCVGTYCNSGTCYANSTGSPVCSCPEGCTGETCGIEDSSSCAAADGVCSLDDGSCPADRMLNVPCCNGNICCRNNLCDSTNCNDGTCYVSNAGSTLCQCPEGCTGSSCADDDDSACNAAYGECLASGTCGEFPTLEIPCCNGKICCQTAIEDVTCEGSTMTLSCDPGFVISINTANYGRDDNTTCPHQSILTDDCSAPSSLSVVQAACDGQQTCSVPVNNGNFGGTDPCLNTYKYLRVSYRCVPAVNLC